MFIFELDSENHFKITKYLKGQNSNDATCMNVVISFQQKTADNTI